MSLRHWRDSKGLLWASLEPEPRIYEATFECTKIPITVIPALKEEPVPWQSGLRIGPTGTGKTYSACRQLAWALRSGASAVFISVPAYLAAVVDAATHPDERIALRAAGLAHYGILDDLGAERLSEYTASELFLLISAREGRPTIVTTNLTVPEIKSIHGDRILSRVLALGKPKRLGGPDRRVLPFVGRQPGDRTSAPSGKP